MLALLPLVSSLAACGSPGFEAKYSGRDGRAGGPLSPVVVGGSGAPEGSSDDFADALMLLPPEAGAVTRLRERHYSNGTRQDIVMRGGTAGDNTIEVSVRTLDSPGRSSGGELLQIGEPSERGVRNEIISRFPDVRMHIVTRPVSNSFGPVGVAVGRRADGARCVFAWQWIADAREAWPNQSNLNRMGALFSSRSAPTSVRIRLCRMDGTVDQLVAMVEGLRAGEGAALGRIIQMDRRGLAVAGASSLRGGEPASRSGDLIPVGGSLEAAIGGGAPVAVAPAAPRYVFMPGPKAAPKPVVKTRVAKAALKAKPTPSKAAPKAVRVARPRPVEPKRLADPNPSPAHWQPAGGPRYMAPVSGAPDASPVGSIAAPVRRLDPALPAQAYRGPSGGAGVAQRQMATQQWR
jgi:hypothetical protein